MTDQSACNKHPYEYFLNSYSLTESLVEMALADVQKSGLKPETINNAGIRIFKGNSDDLKEHLGMGSLNGQNILKLSRLIEFPYFNEKGDILFYRFKLVPGLGDTKYLHPIGKPALAYILPEVWTIKEKANKPLWITEGEKKALVLIQHGRYAIALSGVWNFRAGKNSDLQDDKVLWRELEAFQWQGRMVYLAFDSDLWTNPMVRQALYEFAFKLYERGAIVKIAVWQGAKGIDDYLIMQDDTEQALQGIENTATGLLDFLNPDHRHEIVRAIKLIEHIVEKELVIKHYAKKIGISPRILKAASEGSEGNSRGTQEIFSAYFDGLIDIVSHDDRTAFLIKDSEGLYIKSEFQKDGNILKPPGVIPWLLPRGEAVIENYKKLELDPVTVLSTLYVDILSYFKNISCLPHEGYYHLLTVWVFHTYLPEHCQYTPVISFYAIAERGKSRTGRGMVYVAYRGLHVTSLREAYILRACHDLRATIFFDVMDLWKKAEQNGTEDIILSKFEKGAVVPRVNNPDKGAHCDTTYYNVFGPTILATNESVHRILETRALQINMPEGTKIYNDDVLPEPAIELKERLLAFRSYFTGKVLPEVLKPVNGRLGDITRPLLQIAEIVKPEIAKNLIMLINELNTQRMLEKSETIEARIVKTICDSENKIESGKLSIDIITTELNRGKPEKYHRSNASIGRSLSAMGFEKIRLNDGSMAIWYDLTKISQLKCKYGLQKPSEPSEPSETQPIPSVKTEGSEGTEGLSEDVQGKNYSNDDGTIEMDVSL